MIPKECKRLAEVDFPIAVVSKHAAREKSIRHGHPSTLHLWWARRPLAACRAMLLALLWPDPFDPLCPEDFKKKARKLLPIIQGKVGPTDKNLREALLKFIGDFSNWDLSTDQNYLQICRDLVKAAHGDEPPLVVDPFAGGGSIPLEALRVGCDAFASDLNPVACLILKVMLEDIPRHGPGLADELRRVGAEIKKKAEKELSEFYPKDPDGATPIAYLWARTIRCETPNCGAEIPLVRSFWLCKKPNRKWALRYKISHSKGDTPCLKFEIFEPKSDKEIPSETVSRAKAKCPCCGTVMSPERVRAQLSKQHGGADVVFDKKGNRTGGALMLSVVTLKIGTQGRNYRLPTELDYQTVWKVQKRLNAILDEWDRGGKKGLCPVPDEPTPIGGGSGAGRAFSVQKYGMMQFGDLFSARQKVALIKLSEYIRLLQEATATQNAIKNLMSIVLDRCADYWSSLCSWHLTGEKVNHTYGRQTLPIIWDYTETNPWCASSGNYDGAIVWGAKTVEALKLSLTSYGQVQIADAIENPLPEESVGVWLTDPPYYDAVPYADLSDFFIVWLKRSLSENKAPKDPFDSSNSLSPKAREAVQDEVKEINGRKKDKMFFEETMAKAFAEGRRILREDGIGSVVFAHKTTEGWEALLSGMIKGGWTITGSWPIATEMGARLRARDSAALATSVHLVCRPRPEDAPIGDWGEVLHELPKRVGDWMERLQIEGIRGADLVFACIGPALEIFSRYSRVETADGREVKLAEYLEKVWEVVGRSALEQVLGTAEAKARNGAAGAVEEDARLTALFLWTLQATAGDVVTTGNQTEIADDEIEDEDDEEESTSKSKGKGYSLVFDVVRRFAQPLGIDLPKWEGRVIETKKGIVRLFSISERAKQLFGAEGTKKVAKWIELDPIKSIQAMIVPELEEDLTAKKKRRGKSQKVVISPSSAEASVHREATTLDRVHTAMLLQSSGESNALRSLIQAEQERSPDFLRLANALSALYPRGSEEKRLLDAMLLSVPR